MIVANQSGELTLVFVLVSLTIVLMIVTGPVRAEEVTQEFNGLTINANLELSEGKKLQDGVVLILHGTLAHNRMEIISESQRALLENGHSSLAINLSLDIDNRHGFYDCNWPHRYTLGDAGDELAAWVSWLQSQGVRQVVLMAHSRGANQAMVFAVEDRNPVVTHLVLLAPNTTITNTEWYESRYGENLDEVLARVEAQIMAGKGDELIENIDFGYCPKTTATANSFYSYNRLDDKSRRFDKYLPQLEIPTLILTGTNDDIQPNIEFHLSPYIDGERIQLEKVEGADHFFRDFNIDEAVEAAIAFVAESN